MPPPPRSLPLSLSPSLPPLSLSLSLSLSPPAVCACPAPPPPRPPCPFLALSLPAPPAPLSALAESTSPEGVEVSAAALGGMGSYDTAGLAVPERRADGSYSVPIRILRIHMEEDAAKMVHVGGAEGRIGGAAESLVDYNRCGTPLIELVTEPDLRTPEEARLFMEKLRRIFRPSVSRIARWRRVPCAVTAM